VSLLKDELSQSKQFNFSKYSNTMKKIIENSQSTKELLGYKIEAFQIEELDARLEMHPWVDGSDPSWPPFPGPWPNFICWPIPEDEPPR
jgi:hypothetical protein